MNQHQKEQDSIIERFDFFKDKEINQVSKLENKPISIGFIAQNSIKIFFIYVTLMMVYSIFMFLKSETLPSNKPYQYEPSTQSMQTDSKELKTLDEIATLKEHLKEITFLKEQNKNALEIQKQLKSLTAHTTNIGGTEPALMNYLDNQLAKSVEATTKAIQEKEQSLNGSHK